MFLSFPSSHVAMVCTVRGDKMGYNELIAISKTTFSLHTFVITTRSLFPVLHQYNLIDVLFPRHVVLPR